MSLQFLPNDFNLQFLPRENQYQLDLNRGLGYHFRWKPGVVPGQREIDKRAGELLDTEYQHGQHRTANTSSGSRPAGEPAGTDAGRSRAPLSSSPNYAALSRITYEAARKSWLAAKGAGIIGAPWIFPNDLSTSPKPLEQAKLEIGEIIGWRGWLVEDRSLLAIANLVTWNPAVPMRDNALRGEKVGDHNRVGVHAYKTLEYLYHDFARMGLRGAPDKLGFYNDATDPTTPIIVLGTISMWGTVIEHEHGYRAQFARVRSLELGPEQLLVALRSAYGVGEKKQ